MTALERIKADLSPGENLIWSQTPRPLELYFGKRGPGGAISILLGVVFCYVGLVGHGDARWFLTLFGMLALFGPIFEIVAGYWTIYAITTKRLMILQPSMFETVIESYYPPDIDFIKKRRENSGAGSVVFGAVRERAGKRTETVEIGFFSLPDADAVETMILNLRERQFESSSPCQQ